MSTVKYALPALAAIGGAMAQSCSTSATMTIQSPGDASSLGGCSTFTGTIAVATQAAGSLDFGGLQSIQGSFNVTGVQGGTNNITSISANSLTTISQDLTLQFLDSLTSLALPQLASVDQLMFNALGALSSLSMGKGINASAVTVTNTVLQDISPLAVLQADTITIENNADLHTVNFPTTNVTNLTVAGNGASGAIGSNVPAVSFANLLGAGSIDITNVSSLNLQSLYNTSDLLSIVGTPLTNLSFPNLTQAGGGIRIQNNPDLMSVSFPELLNTGSGSLQIVNNDQLSGAIELPALTTVNSVFNVTGAFTSIFAPNLTHIGGVSNVQSTATLNNATCGLLGSSGTLKGSGGIGGSANCVSNEGGTPGTAAGASSSSSKGSGSKSAASHGFQSAPAMLFSSFAFAAVALGMM